MSETNVEQVGGVAPRNTTTVFHSLSSVAQTLLRFVTNILHPIQHNSRQSLVMACSPVQLAKRALVTLLLTLARQYAMPALPLSRDSPDKEGAKRGITDTRRWSRLCDRTRAPVQGETTSVSTRAVWYMSETNVVQVGGGWHPAT